MIVEKTFAQIMNDSSQGIPSSWFKDKDFYAQWLAQTYYFVCHSTALLGYALPFLKIPALRQRFEHHMGEESRHELLALKDLEKLGYDIKDIPESSMTKAFYQSQYYRINFEGGTSLLGYILYLEGLAVHLGKEVYKEIKDVHSGSTLFLKVHAEEDPHHLQEAIESILKLSLPEQQSILSNLCYSKEIYHHMIADCRTHNKSKKAA